MSYFCMIRWVFITFRGVGGGSDEAEPVNPGCVSDGGWVQQEFICSDGADLIM